MLGDLIARVGALGYRQMIAVIGDAANTSSMALHAGFGFIEAGRLQSAGYKFDRWLDVVFMQKTLVPEPVPNDRPVQGLAAETQKERRPA